MNSILATLILLLGAQAYAQTPTKTPNHIEAQNPTEDDLRFTEESSLEKKEQASLDTDKLKIGGALKIEYKSFELNPTPLSESSDFWQAPDTLSLYLDGRLAENVRGFFRGRLVYDSSVNESQNSISPSFASTKRSQVILEEMKLQFQLDRKVFVTAGVQKIKWGAGRFWNPTDFLNHDKRDFLQGEDERGGLNLLKFHLPLDLKNVPTNLYLIGDFENANQSRTLGQAVRAEVAVNKAEVSLTYFHKKTKNTGLGVASVEDASAFGGDLSMAVGPVDLILEQAQMREGRNTVGGLSWDYQYSDEDHLTLMLEGIWNEAGAKSTAEYGPLLLINKFTPFQVARSYQLVSFYFPKPGTLQNTDLQLFFIRNQVDNSQYHRLSVTWTGQKDLALTLNMAHHWGTSSSEFRLGGLLNEFGAEAVIKF